MPLIREQVDPTTLDQLLIETGGVCPLPRCRQAFWDYYPLDGDQRHLNAANLIPLCQTHYELAQSNRIPKNVLQVFKTLLASQPVYDRPPIRELKTRSEYLGAICEQLFTTGSEFRICYVGPLCLHPDWYFDRRDKQTALPNMDRAIREYLRLSAHSAQPDIKLLFRNTQRYLQKVADVVAPTERGSLAQDIKDEIGRIWGADGERGPEVCCVDTGFSHIPVLFKDAAIAAYRRTPLAQIDSGLLYFDRGYITYEKRHFDEIFQMSNRGRPIELSALREFVDALALPK